MDLQPTAPRVRHRVMAAGRALAAVCLALLCLPAGVAHAIDNLGLGPLSIRNQFPVTLAFLTYTPDDLRALEDGQMQFRYQFSLTNTFINTQSPLGNSTPVITSVEVGAGLTAANFPATGYGVYIDAEAQRHLLRLDYGLGGGMEVGLELAWVRFGGGFLDSNIETVERLFGGLNEDRPYADQDRFDFYVARDGVLLQGTSKSTSAVFQDPVLNLKWMWSEGTAGFPALGFKLAYKPALQSSPSGDRALVASGGSDYSYTIMVAKAVGSVVAHLQWGATHMDVAANTYADQTVHRLMGLEFRIDAERSFLFQSVTQSTPFDRGGNGPGTTDFDISGFTDVLVIGYKSRVNGSLLEYGIIEDYNQLRNEADVTFYFEVGWRW